MDIVVVIISVSSDHEAVMLRESDPPLEGGWTVMAIRKQRRPGKSFQKYHRQYRHAPSFIGEDAAILLIGLSLRNS